MSRRVKIARSEQGRGVELSVEHFIYLPKNTPAHVLLFYYFSEPLFSSSFFNGAVLHWFSVLKPHHAPQCELHALDFWSIKIATWSMAHAI